MDLNLKKENMSKTIKVFLPDGTEVSGIINHHTWIELQYQESTIHAGEEIERLARLRDARIANEKAKNQSEKPKQFLSDKWQAMDEKPKHWNEMDETTRATMDQMFQGSEELKDHPFTEKRDTQKMEFKSKFNTMIGWTLNEVVQQQKKDRVKLVKLTDLVVELTEALLEHDLADYQRIRRQLKALRDTYYPEKE